MYEYPQLTVLSVEKLRLICQQLGLSEKGIKPVLINKILNDQCTMKTETKPNEIITN